MEVVVKDGMVIVPAEILNRFGFLKEGKCRVEITDGEIHILKSYPARERMVKRLRRSTLQLPVDDMIKNEEVEID